MPHSFDAHTLNRSRSSIPARRTRLSGSGPGGSRTFGLLVETVTVVPWAWITSEATGWAAGWPGLVVLALGFGAVLHLLIARLSAGPRVREVGPTIRALLGLSVVPVFVWQGNMLALGRVPAGLVWGSLPSVGLVGLLAGFLPLRRLLKGPWLLDLVGAAGLAVLAPALLARGLAGWRFDLTPWSWEIGLGVGALAWLACLIFQRTSHDLIDVRLRWQRFAYLAQWPLPLLFFDWGRGIGLALCLLSWWDLHRIGRRTAGGRVVFEGTTDLFSIPALAALLTLTPSGEVLSLTALAMVARFVVGWLAAGPYVALFMVFLPDPRTGSLALEFVAPALLTVGLRQLLVRPIGWLWAWGGWVAWLIVMEPPVGLAFAVGTLPALVGVVRLSYRYEPRPLAIALVTASAAAGILAFGQGPIVSLRSVLIDWGSALRAGSGPIDPASASRFASPWLAWSWVLAIPLLGGLAYREWMAERPGRVTPAMVLELSALGVLLAMAPWVPPNGLPTLIVVGLLPAILLAERPAPRAVPVAWVLAFLAGLLAAGPIPTMGP